MKQKEILAIAESMSIDQIDGLILNLQKLKKQKTHRKNKLQETLLFARKDIHPICFIK